MKIQLLVPGKTRPDFISEGVDFYTKRARNYARFELTETKEAKASGKQDYQTLREKESGYLLNHIKPQDYIILLDEKGEEYSSTQFAEMLEKRIQIAQGNLIFLAGGAYGFSDEIYSRANEKTALSRMTFPHQLVRLVFTEQLYRALAIMHNHPYHH